MHDWTREIYEASDRRNWTNKDEREFYIDMRPGVAATASKQHVVSGKPEPGLSSLLITFLLIGLSGALMGAAVTILIQGLLK